MFSAEADHPQSTFIGRAGSKNKGRISRFLANKCSIASRIDCFSDAPTTKFGEALRSQVEERLAFYETGSQPTKNAAAMARVMELLKAEGAEGAVVEVAAEKKEKKKSKKRKSEAVDADATVEGVTVNGEEVALDTSEKKSKKSKKSKAAVDTAGGPLSAAPPAETTQDISMADVTGNEEKKKKKKDKKKAADASAIAEPSTAEMTVDPVEVDTSSVKKAKKEKKSKKEKA